MPHSLLRYQIRNFLLPFTHCVLYAFTALLHLVRSSFAWCPAQKLHPFYHLLSLCPIACTLTTFLCFLHQVPGPNFATSSFPFTFLLTPLRPSSSVRRYQTQSSLLSNNSQPDFMRIPMEYEKVGATQSQSHMAKEFLNRILHSVSTTP